MSQLPSAVSNLLSRAIARVRSHCLLRGGATVGIFTLLAVFAVMAVDARVVIFDDRVRWAMTAGIALVAIGAVLWSVVRPLRRRLDFRTMAQALDARHPEMEERLSTLVELSESEKAHFSKSLFALVGRLAEGDVGKIDLAREFPALPALRRLGVLLLLLVSLVEGIVLSPDLIGRLFIRAIAPWAEIGNVRAKEIEVKPGDVVALSGTVIRLEAKAAASLDAAPSIRISRRRGSGWMEEVSEPMAKGVYETTADMSESEWRYRVSAGPAVTRYYHVRVSERPRYDSFVARVKYPAYTELPDVAYTNAEVGAIRAVAGSRVTFDLKVTEPGTVSDFRIGGEPLVEHLMQSNQTVNWSLDLVNRDGFRSSMGVHPLESAVDQRPTIVVEKPTGTMRLPSYAKVPVEITATDDIAITSVCVSVSIDNGPWEPYVGGNVELGADRRFVRTVADVDLSLYNLLFSKNVRVRLSVDDACPREFGGPHSATSMPFTVQFADNESSYERQETRKDVDSARRDIDEARHRLHDAQKLAHQVRNELRRNGKPTESAERNSEKLAHELDEAEKRIEALRNKFRDDERFEPLTRPMDRLLNEVMKPVLEAVEKAQFREKNERADEVDKAIPEMKEAVQELDELSKRLMERAKQVDQFERTKDLAARQEALAKAAEEILKERPKDAARLEAWKRLEEDAMRRTDELLRQKPDVSIGEAKRKMETAARKMAELKREVEEAKKKTRNAEAEQARRDRAKADAQMRELQAAVNDQNRAAEALRNAASRRTDEAKLRAQQNTAAADNKAREAENFERQASEAQRTAGDRLERGEALEGVKTLQQRAARATEDARKTPQTEAKSKAAAAAQQTAMEALKQEIAVREAMRKDELTGEDLETLNEKLSEGLLKAAGESDKRLAKGEASAEAKVDGEKPVSAPVKSAFEASDALDRELKEQASALGMSVRNEADEETPSAGGGAMGELSDLAKNLERNDGPGFLKNLFSRHGWFKIRGLSKKNPGAVDLKEVPKEYRDLVRRYFLKLNEEDVTPGK